MIGPLCGPLYYPLGIILNILFDGTSDKFILTFYEIQFFDIASLKVFYMLSFLGLLYSYVITRRAIHCSMIYLTPFCWRRNSTKLTMTYVIEFFKFSDDKVLLSLRYIQLRTYISKGPFQRVLYIRIFAIY